MFRLGWSLLLVLAGLTGCAAYHLGPVNGQTAGSHSVRVNIFRNDTLEPRLGEAVATSLRRRLQQDGTYRLETHDEGDLLVNGIITKYDRSGVSFQPNDVLTIRDFTITLTAHVNARDRLTGKVILDRDVTGRTTVRLVADLAAAERQAVPLLAEDLARNLTDLLVEGSW